MFSSSLLASAQGGQATSAPVGTAVLSASGTSIGQDGYRIIGEANPKEPGQKYVYTREMPEDSKGVYWHVEGAVAIDGSPAATYLAGSLDATEHVELTIVWDLAGKDSLVLQLRRDNPESKVGFEVMADLAIGLSSISNRIIYVGGYPDFTPTSRRQLNSLPSNSVILADFFCPNEVDPATGMVQGNPLSFEFESNCRGNSGNVCSTRPNFIWTVQYVTEAGNTYEEKLADGTRRDFSKVLLYWYDRVPYPNTNTNLSASRNMGGNYNVYTWTQPSTCNGQNPNTAQPGELIAGVRLQCTGYSCGTWPGGDDPDDVYLASALVAPAPIRLSTQNPATSAPSMPLVPLCRNVRYYLDSYINTPVSIDGRPLNNNSVQFPNLYTRTYTWSASNGAQIRRTSLSSIRHPLDPNIIISDNRNMELDLSAVPPGVTSITITVTRSTICGPSTHERTLVLPIEPGAPAPQNMRLLGGSCASLNPKTVLVDPDVAGTSYDWSLTGGAYFLTNNLSTKSGSAAGPVEVIVTPNAVPVTVTVRKRLNPCGGFGPPISTTYPIGNLAPGPGQPFAQRNECPPYDIKLIFETVPSGLSYFPMSVANVRNPGTVPIFTPTTPGGPVFDIGGIGSGREYFDLTYFVTSPCPGPGVPGGQQYIRNIFIQKLLGNVQCRGMAGTPPSPVAEPLLELYPNPTSGAVDVKTDETTHYQWVKVFDAQGSLRYQQRSDVPAGIKSFDLKGLTPGIYLVQLFDGERLASQRLVKE